MSKRGQSIALGVLAVVVAGIVVASYLNYQAKIEAAQGEPGTAADVEPEPAPEARPPVVAFIGDSYSPETRAALPTTFAGIIADTEGWKALPFGQGGTGFTGSGQAEEGDSIYLGRVPRVVAAKPDLVFVEGGLNDRGTTAETQAAAARVFAALDRGLPKATLVAIGPTDPPEVSHEDVQAAAAAISAAADEAGIPFVDPRGWFAERPGMFIDGVHLTAEGNQEYAEKLDAALVKLGVLPLR